MVSKKTAHHHSKGDALRRGPVPPGFTSIKCLNPEGCAEIVDVLMQNEGP